MKVMSLNEIVKYLLFKPNFDMEFVWFILDFSISISTFHDSHAIEVAPHGQMQQELQESWRFDINVGVFEFICTLRHKFSIGNIFFISGPYGFWFQSSKFLVLASEAWILVPTIKSLTLVPSRDFWILVPFGESWISVPIIESLISVLSYDSWILVPSHKNEKKLPIPCAFSKVTMLNPISVLVISLPLLTIDSSPLEVVVFWNQ